MDAIIVDTNVVSYIIKGHTLAESYTPHLEGTTPAISFMTVAELFELAFRRSWGLTKTTRLQKELKKYIVIPSSPNLCRIWGRIRAERKSKPISVDDVWIAAAAISRGCSLVTHNPEDFTGIAGLTIITEKK